MFGGHFDVERTIIGWSRKGVPVERLREKLDEFVNEPVLAMSNAMIDEINGGYICMGVSDGRNAYQNEKGAMIRYDNRGWKAYAHPDAEE